MNGIRTYCLIFIMMMHILLNSNYNLNSAFSNIVSQFGIFVLLFMMVSGFSMCCGYYDKIKNNLISPNEFYKKRYKKIFPIFLVMVLIDIIISRDVPSLIEGITDLTLVYSFLPNPNISVIGVAWTLGVIFAFYILFPFFVFLLDNKKRFWLSFVMSLMLNFFCTYYFFSPSFVLGNFNFRSNIIFCSIYFLVGGGIFLYKDIIVEKLRKHKNLILILAIILNVLFFTKLVKFDNTILFTLQSIIIFSIWIIYAIICKDDVNFLNNKFTKYISNISIELYLSHMFIFKILDKLNIGYIFSNDYISYIIMCILTLVGVIVFTKILQKLKIIN